MLQGMPAPLTAERAQSSDRLHSKGCLPPSVGYATLWLCSVRKMLV